MAAITGRRSHHPRLPPIAAASMSPYHTARQRIDDVHRADPEIIDGQPAELLYADRMETWLTRLHPGAPEILKLAARCQHLERWKTPRETFPPNRPGYLAWREALYHIQADRARHLLLESGVPDSDAADLHRWVSKTDLATDPGTQALEDAAVLVFLENDLEAFVAGHPGYTTAKFTNILRKSLKKITPRAREFALSLPHPEPLAGLIHQIASDL